MRKREIKTVLRKARKLIAAGWTQGVFKSADGCYCAVGAIEAVTSGFDTMWPVRATVERQLDGHSLIVWNDIRGRTQGEVVNLFDAAIAA